MSLRHESELLACLSYAPCTHSEPFMPYGHAWLLALSGSQARAALVAWSPRQGAIRWAGALLYKVCTERVDIRQAGRHVVGQHLDAAFAVPSEATCSHGLLSSARASCAINQWEQQLRGRPSEVCPVQLCQRHARHHVVACGSDRSPWSCSLQACCKRRQLTSLACKEALRLRRQGHVAVDQIRSRSFCLCAPRCNSQQHMLACLQDEP